MFVFDEHEWTERIKNPLWYMDVSPVMKELTLLRKEDEDAYKVAKEQIYSFFEKHLIAGTIALGKTGKDFDSERQVIDTIVIHHTHSEKEMTNERLSAMELVRLYAPYYANPTYESDKAIKGEPIYSGHVRDNKQGFYPYHWIVRKNGQLDQLLLDSEIGWHAGKWDINCRSVAIVFDGDYENSAPSQLELLAAANLIKQKYPTVQRERIFGHREVNEKTTCPSNLFLFQDGKRGWKEDLLELL